MITVIQLDSKITLLVNQPYVPDCTMAANSGVSELWWKWPSLSPPALPVGTVLVDFSGI